MKQSKAMSLLEAIISVIVGFGLSIGCQAIFLPLLGVPIPWAANFYFAIIMTVVSIMRQFVLRRVFEALHIRRPLSPFMQAVVAEVFRQREVEGYSAQHDDDLKLGDLAAAGGCYAIASSWDDCEDIPPCYWPWTLYAWNPRDFRRNLVRSAALVIAEGNKFDRNRKQRGISTGLSSHPERGPNLRGLNPDEIRQIEAAAFAHRAEIIGGGHPQFKQSIA